MRYDNEQYEESIDLLALFAEILRKWKLIVIAALIGAVLLGVYKGVLKPEVVSHEEEIKKIQETLDADRATLAANEAEIGTNETTIAANTEKIAASEALLVTQKESQVTLEESLESLRVALAQSQSVLEDPEASVEETASVIVQLPTLTNDIAEVNGQVNSAAQAVKATQDQITAWQAEIETLTKRNESLKDADAALQEKITDQEAKIAGISDTSAGIKPVITAVILGGVLGVFIVCCVVLLQFMLNKKLRSSEELKEQYQLLILGEFCTGDVASHNKLEKLLDKLTGNIQTLPEEKQVYELIAAGIQTPEVSLPMQLVVTGTVDEAVLHTVGDPLSNLLPEGYEITVATNPVYNADLLAKLRQYTVLLVEAKGVSDKREIAKLAEVLCRNDIKVIGAVVK